MTMCVRSSYEFAPMEGIFFHNSSSEIHLFVMAFHPPVHSVLPYEEEWCVHGEEERREAFLRARPIYRMMPGANEN